ncbi:hypothetical protein TL16_g08268, partial [Triparma laevis f. inornata]|uniref:TFIIS N-terminal domain-containing protein n=2 Tax=Triparma laevis TaxID=1534972 RepID=A0A9W7CC02_9STRA
MAAEPIKMKTADELFGDLSDSDDYDTDEALQKARSKKPTMSRLKKKKIIPDADSDSSDSESEDDEKKREKKRKKMEKQAAKKRKKEEKAAKKKEKQLQKKLEKQQETVTSGRTKRTKGGKDKEGGSENKRDDDEDSYDSGGEVERTADDDNFLDLDDDDEDMVKEYNEKQSFDREEGSSNKKTKKRSRAEGDTSSAKSDNVVDKVMEMMKRQKVKKLGVDELHNVCSEIIGKMTAAADADDLAMSQGKPGLEKIKLMPSLIQDMARSDLTRSLLDLNFLSVLVRWISPAKKTGALGNITLRHSLLTALSKMSGETGVNNGDLKRSGLGRIVMGLFKHKDETKEMKKIEKSLIEQWSRPIFNKSGNYRDLEGADNRRLRQGWTPKTVSEATAGVEDEIIINGPNKSQPTGSSDLIAGRSNDSISSNRVSIPFSKGFRYTVRPQNLTTQDADTSRFMEMSKVKQGGVMERLNKKMIEKNAPNEKNARSQDISVEGRGVN